MTFQTRLEIGFHFLYKAPPHIWLFSFFFPARSFCRYHSKFSCWKLLTQKTEGTKTKAARCLIFWCFFRSCTFWILCNLLLLFTFCQVCLPVKETAEIDTGLAEKSSWDQANIRQKLGLVWRNRKKSSQIIKDYFYLPFFLLIILWPAYLLRNIFGFFYHLLSKPEAHTETGNQARLSVQTNERTNDKDIVYGTKYVHIKSTTVYALRRNWDSPNPFLASECYPPPRNRGEGAH